MSTVSGPGLDLALIEDELLTWHGQIDREPPIRIHDSDHVLDSGRLRRQRNSTLVAAARRREPE